ncbi:MAG: tetratricopeptide repeat protein [Gammaproteobacteria bacterium]|nr:tetratricopeptide repeat protein [Gammaproteobacteria bacterium]
MALTILLSGCTVKDFNTGRGAWNAPEYVYQPTRVKRKYAAALKTMESGDDVEAAVQFEQFVDVYPYYPGAYVNLGIIYDRLERTDDAYAMLYRAIDIIPEYVYALNQLGMMKRRAGDFDGARNAWLRATKSDPEYLNAWYNLGVLYDIYMQDLPAALEAYQHYQALFVNTNRDEGYYKGLGVYVPPPVIAPDPEVARWIADLERRIGNSPRAANVMEAL